MGRLALQLELQHSAQELKAHYRQTRDAVERRRTQVIWLLAEGYSREEVAKITAYGKPSIVAWIKRYNQEGLAGLRDKRHENPGAEPLLDEGQRQALFERLQHPPEDGGIWTSQKVADWMTEHLGQEVHVQRGWEYLQRLGFSLQQPRPRHVKADAEEQEAFKKSSLSG